MRFITKTLFTSVCCLLLWGQTAQIHAATINVPADQPTIQAAVSAAVAGDEIVVQPGTYVENVDVNKSVTIRSTDPFDATVVATTIIDGGGVASTITLRQSSVLDGMTITGGNTPTEGGGIVIRDQPSVLRCVIEGNTGQFGGGMMSRGNATGPFIKDCTFISNTANQGSAIFAEGGGFTIKNCQFISNESTGPGLERAAVICRSNMTITNSSFTANTGGGFETTGNGSPVASMDGCQFTANTPFGIRHNHAANALTVSNTSVCNNSPNNVTGNPIVDGGGNNLSGCTIITIEPCCPSDITNAAGNGTDGEVNVFDLLRLLADWGSCTP